MSLLLKRIFAQNCSKSRLKGPKNPFAVGVRRSKTSLLKLLMDLKWPMSRVHFRLLICYETFLCRKTEFPFVAKHRFLIHQSGGFFVGQAHYSIGRVW